MMHRRLAKAAAGAGLVLTLCGGLAACGHHPGQSDPSTTSTSGSTTTSTDNGGISYDGTDPGCCSYLPVSGSSDGSGWSGYSDGSGSNDGTGSNPAPVYSPPPPEIQDPITVPQLGQSGSDWNSGD